LSNTDPDFNIQYSVLATYDLTLRCELKGAVSCAWGGAKVMSRYIPSTLVRLRYQKNCSRSEEDSKPCPEHNNYRGNKKRRGSSMGFSVSGWSSPSAYQTDLGLSLALVQVNVALCTRPRPPSLSSHTFSSHRLHFSLPFHSYQAFMC
jgi:hypothetical protein